MRLKCSILLILLFTLGSGKDINAQADDSIKLNVGDTLPDYNLKVFNYHKQSLNLKDFKGKALVLDFWNKGCGACISSWPRLLKLQNHFRDQLQIILVNDKDSEDEIKKLVLKQESI